jgi:hypothetical protein
MHAGSCAWCWWLPLISKQQLLRFKEWLLCCCIGWFLGFFISDSTQPCLALGALETQSAITSRICWIFWIPRESNSASNVSPVLSRQMRKVLPCSCHAELPIANSLVFRNQGPDSMCYVKQQHSSRSAASTEVEYATEWYSESPGRTWSSYQVHPQPQPQASCIEQGTIPPPTPCPLPFKSASPASPCPPCLSHHPAYLTLSKICLAISLYYEATLN